MPLRSGGAVDNEYARGRANLALTSIGKKVVEWQVVELTPNDLDIYALGGFWQRHCFFARCRWYVFYSDEFPNYNVVYQTSEDGITWSGEVEIVIPNLSNGDEFTLWYDDGNKEVYLVYDDPPFTVGNSLYLKKGTIASNGTISWDSPVKIWQQGGNYLVISIDSICKTSDGKLFVHFTRRTGGSPTTHRCFVKYSTDNGATWLPSGLANAQMISPDVASGALQCVPLTSSHAIFFYIRSSKLYARYWDGTTLGGEELVISGSYLWAINVVQTADGRIHVSHDADHHIRSAGLGGTWSVNSNVHPNDGYGAVYTRNGNRIICHYPIDVVTHWEVWRKIYDGANWRDGVYLGDITDKDFYGDEFYSNYGKDTESGRHGLWWTIWSDVAPFWFRIQTSPLC